MPFRVSFELSETDLQKIHDAMVRVSGPSRERTAQQIVGKAEALLETIQRSNPADYIYQQMLQLGRLTRMARDKGWGLAGEDLERVLTALSYFCEPVDLIPDATPALGFLDDAIVTEIICKELEPELQTYGEFLAYRDAEARRLGVNAKALAKADWLEEKRLQLYSRMRRRRKARNRAKKVKSPFSLI